MLVNTDIVLTKIEVTYNTDPVPLVGTDGVLVDAPTLGLEGARMNERPATRASLGKLQQVQGGFLRSISFDTELKGSGAAGTAPEIGPLLRACALGETIDSGVSVIYAPVSSSHESVTIYYFSDGGKLYKLTGCRGNVSFAMEAGGIIKANFTMTGHCAQPTDVSAGAVTYDSTVPPAIVAGTFSVNTYAATIGALNFDMSNTVATPPDINASDGYAEIRITSRDPNGSIDPEEVLIATHDFESEYRAGTSMAISIGSIGGSAGNIINVDMPAVYYREMSMGDRDGIRTLELPFGMAESTTNDEISLAYT